VLEGAEELSEPEEEELRVLRRDDRDPSRERLACRARLSGSQAVITTRYW